MKAPDNVLNLMDQTQKVIVYDFLISPTCKEITQAHCPAEGHVEGGAVKACSFCLLGLPHLQRSCGRVFAEGGKHSAG